MIERESSSYPNGFLRTFIQLPSHRDDKLATPTIMTAGLNWYVNPYCKCVFNYVHSWADSRPIRNGVIQSNSFLSSQTDAFAMRCQLDF
jgi:phosphate-selective porin